MSFSVLLWLRRWQNFWLSKPFGLDIADLVTLRPGVDTKISGGEIIKTTILLFPSLKSCPRKAMIGQSFSFWGAWQETFYLWHQSPATALYTVPISKAMIIITHRCRGFLLLIKFFKLSWALNLEVSLHWRFHFDWYKLSVRFCITDVRAHLAGFDSFSTTLFLRITNPWSA